MTALAPPPPPVGEPVGYIGPEELACLRDVEDGMALVWADPETNPGKMTALFTHSPATSDGLVDRTMCFPCRHAVPASAGRVSCCGLTHHPGSCSVGNFVIHALSNAAIASAGESPNPATPFCRSFPWRAHH